MRDLTTPDAPATDLRGIGDTSWQARAGCRGMDPGDADALFFPLPRDHEAIAEAKELCDPCPVRRECLNHALENGLREGTWGGLTEAERRPWHEGLSHRLDHSRVIAFFKGRDVHLSETERRVVIDHAYVRGWRPERLALALRINPKHARDLLRQAADKVLDRDRNHGMPRAGSRGRKRSAPSTAEAPSTPAPTPRPVRRPSAQSPLGKAA
ncbi:WhiB family transcriptional regulator [Streptomyces sp. ST2-7A]|uniref:WhiB family transcriptional regulator n=1 Tax=Streptomyces sp. ST2-7A TaxID=2907214 RepID=UPI001F290AAA|nr:WhiB family transcriptional regulator [Streptomyces sp. ST2-7A]MCE7081721.1 WhiB family transcriptional regulator [Streptomyces sp. ST2-7A]